MKKLCIIFILICNIAYGRDYLSRLTRLEYDSSNNLIKVVEFNKNNEQIHEIEYIYDDKNKILKYRYDGKYKVFFTYNSSGRIESIEYYYGLYKFYYKEDRIQYYDLINNYPESGRYYIFAKEPVYNLSRYGFLTASVVKNGDIILLKPDHESFNYSNFSPNIKVDKNGYIIEKAWGDQRDAESHIKYFTYDSNGNLIEVKAIKKVKVFSAFFQGMTYLFAVMLGGYKN